MPLVSVGLPVYNGEAYLEQSIRSVLSQDFTDLELIIADNASTDATLAIIERCAADDDRIVILHSDENRGAAWNYNRVFDAASGDYFRWHAHDDYFEPGLLTALVGALEAQPDAVLAHSWTQFIADDPDTPGSVVVDRVFEDDLGATSSRPHERLALVIRRLTYCNAVFGLIRRDELARTARIAPFPGSDVPLLYELALRGTFAVVPEPLYTRRPGNSIKSNPSKRLVAEWFDPRASGARFPGARQWWAVVTAVWRTDMNVTDRLRCIVTFHAVWPVEYVRRVRRRARRGRP